MDKYDIIILGGGPGGMYPASILSRAGKKVAMVQSRREDIGGVCLNKGCMPSKALLKSASVFDKVRHSEFYGLNISTGDIDLSSITDSVENKIEILRQKNIQGAEELPMEFIYGMGTFIDEKSVEVELVDGGTRVITADIFILATGSEPAEVPGLETDGKFIVTSDDMLQNRTLPEKLLIIGGGAIGLEFATMYSSFGSEVTVVERMDTVLANESFRAGQVIAEKLGRGGISIKTGLEVKSLHKTDSSVKASFSDGTDEIFHKVLVAVGRKPLLHNLNLESAGVETENGFIKVNDYLQTSNENIYAAGDVIGHYMFAHAAGREGTTVGRNILNGNTEKMDNSAIPRIVFSSPEFAAVGITEASEDIEELTLPLVPNGRSLVDSVEPPVISYFYSKNDGKLRGAYIIGEGATESIQELVFAVQYGLTLPQIRETTHGHPTYNEALLALARQYGRGK